MGAQIITEIYRTREQNGTYHAAYTITYFGSTAQIQGLSGRVSPACIRELIRYLQTKTDITHLSYIRKKPTGERNLSYELKNL